MKILYFVFIIAQVVEKHKIQGEERKWKEKTQDKKAGSGWKII